MSSEKIRDEDDDRFISGIKSAFDLASGGMAVHLEAVNFFHSGAPLTKWLRNSLGGSGSNYLITPYILSWRNFSSEYSSDFGPSHQAPQSQRHLELISTYLKDYKMLDWRLTRITLGGGGDLGLMVDNPDGPITESELPLYLYNASDLGLVSFNPDSLPKIQNDDPFYWLTGLLRQGVDFKQKYLDLLDEVTFSDKIKPILSKAAVHKLGAMLAVTDQLTFDAYSSGTPIPASYHPDDRKGNWSAAWLNNFGRKLPTIEELYTQALEVFCKVADKSDPLVRHLFYLDTPNYFSR